MSSKPFNPTPPPQTTSQATLTGVGNLIKLLPTGTVFAFQFLNPVFTINGQCHPINKVLTSFLIAICGLSCFFATFTDSYMDTEGNLHYGFATTKGLWPSSPTEDLASYKICFGDFVHAFLSLVVFAVVSLLDPNTVECFYPSFESTQKALMMAMPAVIGAVSGAVFVMFPNKRHGIGYPSSQT